MKKILNTEELKSILSNYRFGRHFEDTELPFNNTLQYKADSISFLINEKTY